MAVVPDRASLYSAVQLWKARCLVEDRSIFSDEALWTLPNLHELQKHFVDSPDESDRNFLEKLKSQLAPTAPATKRLAAEMLWVILLFPKGTKPERKAELVRTVWDWGMDPLDPGQPLLRDPFSEGIGGVGQSFNQRRWAELAFLIRFSQAWKGLPIPERHRLSNDAWAFAQFLDTTEGADRRQMRHALLHVLFPETFERIASGAQRRRIDEHFAELSQAVQTVPGDTEVTAVDRRLAAVRAALSNRFPGQPIDFYRSPVRDLWIADTTALQRGLQKVLAEYQSATTTPFSGSHPLVKVFNELCKVLAKTPALTKRPTVSVKAGTGKGNWAHTPWIALLDSRETTTTQHGVYGVYLFRRDMSGVYLTLNQGVRAPLDERGRPEGHAYLRERAESIRQRVSFLKDEGFILDNEIDLRANGGLGSDYEISTIAHKFYPSESIPSDDELVDDVESLLSAYDEYLEVAHPQPSRTWIFQGNPRYFDTRGASQELRKLTWLVNNKAAQIRSGDRVYLWESGPKGGIVAIGTITADPSALPMDDAERPFSHDLDRFDGVHLRVPLRIDQTLQTALDRETIAATPGLSELSILRQAQGTNFAVTKEEAIIIEGLLSRRPTPVPPEESPRLDLTAIHESFSGSLLAAHLSFGTRHTDVVRAFIASLATKRFVILTGLSGSGKTQLALRFGEWCGEGRHTVIAVRPDWTGPEALLGYEDALLPVSKGRRAWHVPSPLGFVLKAAGDRDYPYVMILDEMNLAHVERYFADILSGMESGTACLPQLVQEDGNWYPAAHATKTISIPDNLFVIGTVNVDETTYSFSPKVLDRANTIEFRVTSDDLAADPRRPEAIHSGPDPLVRGMLEITRDHSWHRSNRAPSSAVFQERLRTLHALLSEGGFEFGHRVFYEANRFASMLAAAGDDRWERALDLQIIQKVLPRLHGSRRRLEPTLVALYHFCVDPSRAESGEPADADQLTVLPSNTTLRESFTKTRRMLLSLRANQFASFSE